MTQTTIVELTGDGWKHVGTITANDGMLSCQPEGGLLATICGEPIITPDGMEVSPKDAEAFAQALPLRFCGGYLRASLAKEGGDDKS